MEENQGNNNNNIRSTKLKIKKLKKGGNRMVYRCFLWILFNKNCTKCSFGAGSLRFGLCIEPKEELDSPIFR